MADHAFSGWSGAYLVHPCMTYFPTGWGGTVTDSVTQFVEISYLGVGYTEAQGEYTGSIGTTESNNYDVKSSQIDDAARFLVCGDSISNSMGNPLLDAFQVCHNHQYSCGADWSNCSYSQQCGISDSVFRRFWTDPSFRSKYTRHLGGSNFGFADGHAAWWQAEAFLNEAPHQDCPNGTWHDGTIAGAGSYNYVVACPNW
jgi:prepilin-type processing-associated H-X9-DG protein